MRRTVAKNTENQNREISGRVVDDAGKGIAGADVGLQEWTWMSNKLPDGPFLAVAKADADGRFRLLVPEGHDLRGNERRRLGHGRRLSALAAKSTGESDETADH